MNQRRSDGSQVLVDAEGLAPERRGTRAELFLASREKFHATAGPRHERIRQSVCVTSTIQM